MVKMEIQDQTDLKVFKVCLDPLVYPDLQVTLGRLVPLERQVLSVLKEQEVMLEVVDLLDLQDQLEKMVFVENEENKVNLVLPDYKALQDQQGLLVYKELMESQEEKGHLVAQEIQVSLVNKVSQSPRITRNTWKQWETRRTWRCRN